ncbi:MAG TPA: mechanosensitive ion channel domain-containing protein [Eoetvoesiella sp.]
MINNRSINHTVQRWALYFLGFLFLTLIVALSAVTVHSQPLAQPEAPAPSYGAMADLLENEQTRDELIRQLRSLALSDTSRPGAGADSGAAGALTITDTAAVDVSASQADHNRASDQAGRQDMAGSIQAFIASLSRDFSRTAGMLKALLNGEGVHGMTTGQWLSVLTGFCIVAVATLLAFFIFRVLATRFFNRIDLWLANGAQAPSTGGRLASPPLWERFISRQVGRKWGGVIGALVIDVAVTLLAALAGYAVVVFGSAEQALNGTFGIVFINAFVAVELAKALSRAVFARHYAHLRLLDMPNDVAIYWDRWIARLVSLTGYGLLVVAPLIKTLFLPSVGQAVGLIIMLGVYVYAVGVIWANRAVLRARLTARAEKASAVFLGTLIRILARVWHVLAIAYFTVLLVVSQIDQQGALPFMAQATFQTVCAAGLGAVLASILSSLLSQRIRLSDDLRTRLPMLEARLNAYVPAAIKGLRLFLLFAIALIVLDAWHVFDLTHWLYSDSGRALMGLIVRVSVVLLMAVLAWTVMVSVIEHRLSVVSGSSKPTEREKTLLSLFRNAALIVIVTMTVLVILSQIGIDIGPLIAGAGVVGLAVGFGAQKLVQDVITGVFIQLENGMNQNDVVEVCGLFGTVEKITIRSVVIRTLDGGYHLIPFSSIETVSNHTREFGYHYGEYTIAHRANVDDAIVQLNNAFEELMQDSELAGLVLESISIPGVTSLNERGFTIRVLIKTMPGMQWAVQRGYNRLVKKYFNAAGIELPYPQTVVHFAQDEKGVELPFRFSQSGPGAVGV